MCLNNQFLKTLCVFVCVCFFLLLAHDWSSTNQKKSANKQTKDKLQKQKETLIY
jgi:hypothetical protein